MTSITAHPTNDIAQPPPLPKVPSVATVARDFAYLVCGLPLGVATFTLAVTGLSLAVGLAITLIGIPVLLGTLIACRWIADLERYRANALVGVAIERSEREWKGGILARSRAAATDLAAWRDVLWSLLLLPLGIAGFTAAVTSWAVALGLATSPAWYWALPDEDDTIPLLESTAIGWSALRVVIGLLLIGVAIALCRGLALGIAHLARLVLGPRGRTPAPVRD